MTAPENKPRNMFLLSKYSAKYLMSNLQNTHTCIYATCCRGNKETCVFIVEIGPMMSNGKKDRANLLTNQLADAESIDTQVVVTDSCGCSTIDSVNNANNCQT